MLDVVCVTLDEDNFAFHFAFAITAAFFVLTFVEFVINATPTVAMCLFATFVSTDVSTTRTSYALMFVAAMLLFMFVADVAAVLYAPIDTVARRSPIPPPPPPV